MFSPSDKYVMLNDTRKYKNKTHTDRKRKEVKETDKRMEREKVNDEMQKKTHSGDKNEEEKTEESHENSLYVTKM